MKPQIDCLVEYLYHIQCLSCCFSYIGNDCFYRWCRLNRPRKLSSVNLIVIEGIGYSDFRQHPDAFPCLANSFSEVDIIYFHRLFIDYMFKKS